MTGVVAVDDTKEVADADMLLEVAVGRPVEVTGEGAGSLVVGCTDMSSKVAAERMEGVTGVVAADDTK